MSPSVCVDLLIFVHAGILLENPTRVKVFVFCKKCGVCKNMCVEPLKALIFDSFYDEHRGVIAYVRVFRGSLRRRGKIYFAASGREFEPVEIGFLTPKFDKMDEIHDGEIGYVMTGLKDIRAVRVGDTLVDKKETEALAGYARANPMVFAGIFCADNSEYGHLRDSLEKLELEDASMSFEPENSGALGLGFRCGFLGLLHLDIITTRLEREYNLDLIVTAPSVKYELEFTNGEAVSTSNPADIPDAGRIKIFREPRAKVEIVCRREDVGAAMKLSEERRGEYLTTEFLGEQRARIDYNLPLSRIISDFYDKLKNATAGYASMSYEIVEMREDNLVKVDILIADELIPSLAFICHRDEARTVGMAVVGKLKEVIPRQMFVTKIQAAIGATFIARETISAYRKDVTAKLYGGDITRRNKLLEKQKKGKKKRGKFGKVELPKEAFLAVVRAG